MIGISEQHAIGQTKVSSALEQIKKYSNNFSSNCSSNIRDCLRCRNTSQGLLNKCRYVLVSSSNTRELIAPDSKTQLGARISMLQFKETVTPKPTVAQDCEARDARCYRQQPLTAKTISAILQALLNGKQGW